MHHAAVPSLLLSKHETAGADQLAITAGNEGQSSSERLSPFLRLRGGTGRGLSSCKSWDLPLSHYVVGVMGFTPSMVQETILLGDELAH